MPRPRIPRVPHPSQRFRDVGDLTCELEVAAVPTANARCQPSSVVDKCRLVKQWGFSYEGHATRVRGSRGRVDSI